MNKDEIEIDGVIYIKKELATTEQDKIQTQYDEPIYYKGAVIETDKYCFDAHVLIDEDNPDDMDMFSVEVSDKRKVDWRTNTEHWDNPDYFHNLVIEDIEAMETLKEDIPEKEERNNFINFIYELQKKNWF